MKTKVFLLAFLMVAGITASFAPPALAQDFDLTVIPAKEEVEALPGQSVEFSIELRNNGANAIQLLVYPMDYYVSPDNTFFFEPPGTLPNSCADWIGIGTDRIEIPAGSWFNAPFRLTVPPDAENGGHYAVIFFQDASGPQPGQGAELTPRVGAQVLLTVPGEIIREGEIAGFEIEDDFFSLWAPPAEGAAGWPARNIEYRVETENTGNVHITVSGVINYRSKFGLGSGSVELGSMTILPGTVRYFEGILPGPPLMGWFEAEVSVMYGPDQFTFDVEKKAGAGFAVIPVLWILAFILAAPVLWGVIHLVRKRLRLSIRIEKKQ